MFLIVILVALNFQYAVSSFAWIGFLFGMTALTDQMHVVAMALGVGSLIVGFVVKLTP